MSAPADSRARVRALTVPPPLAPGDRVVVVAPSSPPDQRRLAEGCEILRSWGLEVVLAPQCADTHVSLGYLAGQDDRRAKDLTAAWCAPDVAAIVCACGGYGAQRMVDLLDWEAMSEVPAKPLVGFSDATVLHEAFALRLGVSTLLGPMPATRSLCDGGPARDWLRTALFESPYGRVLTAPGGEPLGEAPHLRGIARGVTVGGCLSLLTSNLATEDGRTALRDGLLVIEDVEEADYRLDRMLTQALRAGWFEGVAGIALGSWTDCGPPESVRAVMLDRLGDLGVPVGWNFGFGHVVPSLTIPLGVPAELDPIAGTLRVLGRDEAGTDRTPSPS